MRATKTIALALLVLLSLAFLLQGDLPTVPTGTWTPSNSLAEGRSASGAALLQDGRILFTGGTGASGPLASAELFNTDGTFSSASPMQNPRASHTAVVLQDGRVLVAGGTTSGGGITSSAEIYDPASNSWTTVAGGMTAPRSNHTASLLADGTVLIAGGQSTSGALNSLEIFDPAAGAFAAAPDVLSSARQSHAAAVLQNGQVLLVGGSDGTNTLASSDLFDPESGLINPGPALSTPRQGPTATIMIDGRVLVAGGNNGTSDLASAEIFQAGAGFSVTGAMAAARSGHRAFLLPNNNGVLIVGGSSAGTPLASAELFYPWTGTFNATGGMATARTAAAGAALKQNGMLLVAGGTDGTNQLASGELYGFATVKTDKADYQPGEIVTITGMGWQPGETVTLTFLESPNIDTHPPLTAVADANGNISNTQFSPDSHDVEILFYLTATGSISQAQTVFTDGTASSGDGSMVVSPTFVAAGSTGNTLTFTFTAQSGKDFSAGSQATILVPAGWTVPTSGNVTVAPVSCSAATLGTITGSGPWTIPINMTCPGGDSFTATFSGVTAPGTAGSNQFTTKTKQNLGTLTNISVQPTVTVQAASKLAFLQQPTNTQEGTSITPGVTVQVQDANGDLLNTSTASITIAISNNPGGGTLAGTVTAAAVNGVATFSNLSINKTGTGYTLSATSAGLATATSSAFNITPGAPTHLVFGQQPTNAQAGASITPAVTVQVLDANNNLVSTGTGSTASITMAIGTNPSGGTLSGTTTVAASGGIATFSNLSISKVGNGYTLTAASSGLTGTASSAFNITAGTVSAGASTVSSNPASVTADGSTTSTITVTLLDASSNPVSGKTVTLAKSGGSSTISVASGSSSASGVVTFTVKDAVAEATTYTATDTTDSITITQTAIVTFTAGTVSAATSTVSANPTSVVADGASTSTITVTLKDANNNPVSGKTVSLAAGSGSSTITTVSGTTSASGQASFTVKDTVVESVTYTAKDTTDNITVTPTATVNFTVGPANPGTSTVTANPTSVPADGSTTSTITVTLKDASSRPVSGKTVTLSQGTGTSTISAASGPSNASGVVTFTVKDTKAEAVTYTATDTTDSVTITQTATVTFSNPAPTTTSISPSSKNAGDAGFTLTVNGTNFVSTSTVNFSGSGRTATFVSATQVTASITAADVATAGSFPITVTNSAPGGGTSNPQTLTVNPKLAFTSAAFANLTGVCSPQINAQIQNANGTAATLTAPITLSLSSNSATGKFFSDATCATPVAANSITIAAGSSTATFFYNDTTVGSPVITVASTGLTSIQQAETITSLRFGSTAFAILVGQCSSALSVQSANTSGGNPTSLTQATTINLSSSSAGGKFYSDATCTTQITSTTISPSIDAGHDSPNFFYKDAVAGNPTLTASAGTASATQAETINKATTAFSNLTASQTIAYGKASINLSGTIAAGSTFPPTTETVGITINSVTVQAAIGANGAFSASFDSHAIPASASAYTITYSYAGDANFTSGTNTATTLKVNPATTSTALVSSLNPSFSGQSVTFTATVTNTSATPATPTGTVQFLDNGSPLGSPQPVNAQGKATLTSTSLSVGAHPITASYVNSDGDFSNSTSSSVNQTVNSATTTTTVMSSLNPSAFGQSVTFTATMTSPGGTPTGSVQFSIDGLAFGGPAALISGMATSSAISSLGAGSHAISAVYSGDGNFLTSTGGLTQNVNQVAPAVSDSGPSSSTFGQQVTLSVTVAPPNGGTPTGTVTFSFVQNSTTYFVCSDGTVSSAPCTVNVIPVGGNYVASVTTSKLPPGTDGVMATYSGDTNFQGEPANSVSVTVSQADTATTLTKSQDPSVYGDSVNLAVKVKDNSANSTGVPTGTVTLSFKLDPNDPNAQVYYICGDGTISTTACGAQNQIGLSADSTDPQGQTATATVTTANLPAGLTAWSFAYAINASYAGDTNFKASGPVGLNQTVNQRPITVTAATDTKTYDGVTSSAGAPTITAGTLANGDTSNFTESFDNRNAGMGKALTPAGTVKDGFGGNNYAVTFTSVGTGVINPLAITVTAVADKKIYDGTMSSKGMPAIAPALISPDASGFTQTFDTRNVGTGKTLTASGSANDGNSGNNYAVTFVKNANGEIDSAALTITAVTNTKTYDATIFAGATPTATGLQPGDTVSGVTETYDTKNVGTGKTLSVATYAVTDGNSGHNYTVTTVTNATGVISQAPLTITAVTNTKTYDATIFAGATPAVSGLQGTDTVTGLSETYDTPTAGAGKTLSVATYTVNDGNSGGNYAVVPVADHTGVILQATPVVVDNGPPVSTFGQPVTLSVTVAPPSGGTPTGTVAFTFTQNSILYYVCADGSISTTLCSVPVTLSNGNYVASVSTSKLPTAADNVMATYSGDTNFQGEPANNVSVTVSQANTATTLASSEEPATYGDSVTLTMKVQDSTTGSTAVPTGTMSLSFQVDPLNPATTAYICGDGTIVSTPCASGIALAPDPSDATNTTATATVTAALPAGLSADSFQYTITAAYSGDPNFNASNVGLAQIVNQRATTTTVALTAGPSTSIYGQSLTFTATVTGNGTGAPNPSSGNVQFKVDGADAGSVALSGNTASLTTSALTAGSHNITATYLGSSNFAASVESTAVSQTVNKASTTTVISSITPEPSVVGQPYTVNVTLSVTSPGSGTPTGTITVSGDGSCTITLPGTSCMLTATSVGSKTITAAYGGDSNFNGSTSSSVNHTVNKADTTTALSSSANPSSVYGQSVTLTATVTVVSPGAGTPTGTVTFKDGTTVIGTGTLSGGVATFSTTTLSATTHSITACYGSDSNFNASNSAAFSEVVNPAPLTITANNATKTYGQTLAFAGTEFTTSGLLNVDTVTNVTLTSAGAAAAAMVAGSLYAIVPTAAAGSGLTNYTIKYVNGYLTVNTASLTITASSFGMIYGGPVPPITASYSGFVNSESASNLTTQPTCGTLATSSSPVATYASNCSGAVDNNYTITYAPGVVTVTQATTTTTVTSSLNPSNWMQVAVFTATVAPQYSGTTPTGSVGFYDVTSGTTCSALGSATAFDTEPLPTGTASASTSTPALPVGTDTILACYSGDTNFISSGGTLSQTVIPAPIAVVSPASGLSFGNQQVGTTSGAQVVTVSNPNGTAALSISNISITGTNATYFKLQSMNNCSSVSAGTTATPCTINIVFSPADTGAATAILTVTDNNENASGSMQSISVAGAATSSISSVGSLATYGIFATANGCSSFNGSGGISVDSFNSGMGYASSHQNGGGNIGTDGNVTLSGGAVIYGSVSSPFTGSGNCNTKSMTGYSTSGKASATGGEVLLSQPLSYPTPPPPSPAPPTSNQNISGTCGSTPGCTNTGSKTVTLAPGQYGNLNVSGGTAAHVTVGTYNINSLTLSGNSTLVVDSGPVIVNIAGNSLGGNNAVLDLTGGTMSNSSGIPSNLQFYFGGSKAIKLSGGTGSYAVVYAPNSPINVSGGSHFYGSIVGGTINDSGNTAIHYDTNLPSISAGNYIWFNSAGLNVQELPAGTVKLYVTDASINFTANGTLYNLAVPNAVITFSSTATSASTTWDSTNNRWTTLVPTSMVSGNATIHTFLDGLAFPVPSTFSDGIQNVTWTAAFSTDTPGISFQWQWGAAVYSSFTTTDSLLVVNPVDNSDPAGTPESYKSNLIFGATGAGPTGLYVGTAGVVPTIAEASTAPSSLDFSNGGTLNQTVGTTSSPMKATLTNNQSGPLTISSITVAGTNPGDFAQTNNCPISPKTLAGGGTCTFTVTFKPTATGKRTAKIALNDDANNSPQTLFLKGTGQ